MNKRLTITITIQQIVKMPFKPSSLSTASGRMTSSSHSSNIPLPSLVSSTRSDESSLQTTSSLVSTRPPYYHSQQVPLHTKESDASSTCYISALQEHSDRSSTESSSERSSLYHSCLPSTSFGGAARQETVKPYRFRDEPNKRNIVKTEYCKAVLEGRPCRFGKKCNFAHHESELKYQTLVARDEANLCDIETHRTRPCFYHVATGDW